MKKKVTIKDIAKLVGVTPATVSYVLTGSNRVGTETKNRVLAAAQQLNYHPNMSARALAKNRSYTIGLFIPTSPRAFLDPFFAEILRGLSEAALNHGYMTCIIYAPDLDGNEAESGRVFDHLDGIVLTEVKAHDKYIDYLRTRKVPFVSSGRGGYLDFDDYVYSDCTRGVEQAMKYLYGLGHRKIGCVLGPLAYPFVQDRYRAYRQVLSDLGLPINWQHIATGENSFAGGEAAVRRILRANVQPTAILAATDVMAMGIIEHLHSVGFMVPDDISVVGYDDAPFAKYASPSLTTIRQNVYELGRQAAIMLIAKLEELPYDKPVGLPVRFVVRRSTSAPMEKTYRKI